MEKPNKMVAYRRAINVINSCNDKDQLKVALQFVQCWVNMFHKWNDKVDTRLTGALQGMLRAKGRLLDDNAREA